jgi:uncharacterized phage protein gp47/JayE
MNPDTVNLIERPYQEIVDDILTAIVGGVVNEPIFYDLKETFYPLSQPAADVRVITGTRTITVNGTLTPIHFSFQKEVDFVFSEGDNAVVWQSGASAAHPDDETIFYVDYFRPESESRSPLSDINVGSITRTLGEAIGREIATVYQQVNQAYLSGFIDTAQGQALDLVVSILGVQRKTKEFAVGLVTFFRDAAAGDGNISLPESIALSTEKGEATFVTTDLRTLQRGQARIDVPIRASDTSKGEAGIVKSGVISKLSQPITGIARVTNFEATVLGAEGETDQQLRLRARARLRGLGKATLAALANAIFEGRGKLLEVWDPNSALAKQSKAGVVTLLIEAEPERFPSLSAAVHETRAAGVQATVVARYVFFKLHITTKITSSGKEKIKAQIINALQQYVDSLSAGDPAKGDELLKAIKSVKEADNADTKIVDVMAWHSDIGQPSAETLIDALLDAVSSSADDNARREAISRVLTETTPTTASAKRIPDRGLVQGAGDQRATDTEIDHGVFKVVPPDKNWFVVLDVEPADIDLKE